MVDILLLHNNGSEMEFDLQPLMRRGTIFANDA